MLVRNPARLSVLRVFLPFAAIAWVCVFLTWDVPSLALQGMGAKPVAYDPMLDYWLRLASGAFTLIGVGYLMLALNPRKYASALRASAWLMVLEGIILAAHGFRLGLPPFPFVGDIAACFICGGVILPLQKATR